MRSWVIRAFQYLARGYDGNFDCIHPSHQAPGSHHGEKLPQLGYSSTLLISETYPPKVLVPERALVFCRGVRSFRHIAGVDSRISDHEYCSPDDVKSAKILIRR